MDDSRSPFIQTHATDAARLEAPLVSTYGWRRIGSGRLSDLTLRLDEALCSVRVRPFEEIVMEHGSVVRRLCRSLLDPADADDAWAETFLAALRAYPKLRPGSNVRGWLVTIAHRKAIDQIRAASRRPQSPADVGDIPSSHADPAVRDRDLWAAWNALPRKQRRAVAYHHVAGLPYTEVGVLLETSEAAARRSAADGIANLRKTYAKARKGRRT
jgi:RNA polymerase sigma factor (sigma-70 family)